MEMQVRRPLRILLNSIFAAMTVICGLVVEILDFDVDILPASPHSKEQRNLGKSAMIFHTPDLI
jgi:hypothetical protein